MYKFSYFTEQDQETVIAFMKANPLAIVTGFGIDYPVASHLPIAIEIKEDGQLFFTGHLMKNTDHHKGFEKNPHVLVIFNGPNTFVSANWYEKKDVGSTWNYMTVHAKGKIRFMDEEGTYNAVKAISDKYVGLGTTSSFDNLPEEYISKMVKAIVGFEIEVVSFDNVFKLSQNYNEATRKSIADHLNKRGDGNSIAIAKELEKRFDQPAK